MPRHAGVNRAEWDRISDEYQQRHGEQIAAGSGWGVWQLPEAELRVLGDVDGLDTLELGCGAAQWSIALAGRGARPTGLDLSPRQLEHAGRAMAAAGVDFPLLEANAEAVPLPDASFDVVFCDHGAFNFADPKRLVPEAARLLRPGGLLAFCMPSPLLDLFYDTESDRIVDRPVNDYADLRAFESKQEVAFQLPYGEWIRLFRGSGFVVEDLIELIPPEGAETTYEHFVPYEWARRWPAENIWKARRS